MNILALYNNQIYMRNVFHILTEYYMAINMFYFQKQVLQQSILQ